MKFRSVTLTTMLAVAISLSAQMPLASSHGSTTAKPAAAAQPQALAGKPAARVNGTVLTELELRRELFTIFPYAQQHNGTFPQRVGARHS
jgi:peptidyl-prolyl cis-trans isomerase SurA